LNPKADLVVVSCLERPGRKDPIDINALRFRIIATSQGRAPTKFFIVLGAAVWRPVYDPRRTGPDIRVTSHFVGTTATLHTKVDLVVVSCPERPRWKYPLNVDSLSLRIFATSRAGAPTKFFILAWAAIRRPFRKPRWTGPDVGVTSHFIAATPALHTEVDLVIVSCSKRPGRNNPLHIETLRLGVITAVRRRASTKFRVFAGATIRSSVQSVGNNAG